MSETIPATEANRHFSRLLREVGQGKSFTITSHGQPVARIVPATAEAEKRRKAREALMARLRAQPATEPGIGPWTRDELYERD